MAPSSVPGQSGEALERLARERYLQVDYPGSIEAHERAFAAYRTAADGLGAARAARAIAWLRGNVYGDWAVANGWLARAATLLESAGEDSPERGWIEVIRAWDAPDGPERERLLRTGLELGRRFGDADLEILARGQIGHMLVLTGHPEEGMLLLDEALAAVCAGDAQDVLVVESCFCGMFQACERAQDVTRAEQWMRAADEMANRRKRAAVGAFCRAHYAGILTAAGRWDEAESELHNAARIFERGYVANRAGVMVRLADLRVRQGRMEEAAVLLDGLDQHPEATRPLAALHLARGETKRARDLLERKLAEPDLHAQVAASLLTLLVDALVAEGAVEEAEAAATRMSDLAARNASPYLQACSALCTGKVCLVSGTGDPQGCLHKALAAFSLAHMPMELAHARLELARATAQEQPDVAVAEASAALEAFERRQAARDADAAAELLRRLGAPGRSWPKRYGQLTKRETEVLELLAEGCSNAQISQRLFISPRTAEHHVASILSKLGLSNRAEAAAYAVRELAAGPVRE